MHRNVSAAEAASLWAGKSFAGVARAELTLHMLETNLIAAIATKFVQVFNAPALARRDQTSPRIGS
ncbi:MAG: hypothetical protein MI861_02290 [Pirellulales bacterium]|nr:hypothetical protein [Pirellulales bacterium]